MACCLIGQPLFFFFFLNLTYSTSSLPSCLWSLRIFPSLPDSRLRAVLCGHQNVVFRRQKRTTFDVRNSTYFTFYVGHSTRQGISLLRVSNRITHDMQPHTSQRHSVQQLTLIFTFVRYFEYCFQKPIAAPRWTPADAAPLFHTPRSSGT